MPVYEQRTVSTGGSGLQMLGIFLICLAVIAGAVVLILYAVHIL